MWVFACLRDGRFLSLVLVIVLKSEFVFDPSECFAESVAFRPFEQFHGDVEIPVHLHVPQLDDHEDYSENHTYCRYDGGIVGYCKQRSQLTLRLALLSLPRSSIQIPSGSFTKASL